MSQKRPGANNENWQLRNAEHKRITLDQVEKLDRVKAMSCPSCGHSEVGMRTLRVYWMRSWKTVSELWLLPHSAHVVYLVRRTCARCSYQFWQRPLGEINGQ